MKKLYKLVALSTIVLMTSCTEEVSISQERKSFELQADVSVTIANEQVYKFEENKHQTIYTTDKRKYMISNTDQTEYYSLIMGAVPLLNAVLVVNVAHLGIGSGLAKETYNMNVIKKEGDKLWLWDEKEQVGFVLKH